MSMQPDQAFLAASMYYEQNLTMDAVARELGVSRSSVSRLLAYARDNGIVRIEVSAPSSEPGSLAGEFQRLFGVNTFVVPTLEVDSPTTRLNSVATVAAKRLTSMMSPGMTLGVAWGNTLEAVVQHVSPAPMPGSTVVQLNGAANASVSGIQYADSILSKLASAYDSTAVHFPVPAFFDHIETWNALKRERSIQRVISTINSCNLAVFSVGATDPAMPSHVYAAEYLSAEEMRTAHHDGVVGDVCTVLLREDGTTNMDLNSRASGPTTEQLKRIPRRLCVVAGRAKAAPLLGALRAGVVTDLILDSSVARATLVRMSTRRER